MQILLTAAIVILASSPLTWATEPELIPHLDSNNPDVLREGVRVLEAETKLAAQPQTYVVIDLADKAVLLKTRGIILHRMPIEQYSTLAPYSGTATYHLLERPPVSRRKIDPVFEKQLAPISLDDMPTEFFLRLAPSLTIHVRPSSGNLWDALVSGWSRLWIHITHWSRVLATGKAMSDGPTLFLVLATDQAKSLAWSVTQDMPFLIRRASHGSLQP